MFLDALFQLEIGKLTRFQTDCRRHTSNGGFKFQKLEADFLASKYIFSLQTSHKRDVHRTLCKISSLRSIQLQLQ